MNVDATIVIHGGKTNNLYQNRLRNTRSDMGRLLLEVHLLEEKWKMLLKHLKPKRSKIGKVLALWAAACRKPISVPNHPSISFSLTFSHAFVYSYTTATGASHQPERSPSMLACIQLSQQSVTQRVHPTGAQSCSSKRRNISKILEELSRLVNHFHTKGFAMLEHWS